MAQIPVFGGGQVLNVSSPVPVASADSSAGNLQGNAAEGFGKALFQLGNMLDEAGRKAKDEADKYEAKIAVNAARDAMLEAKAFQAAQEIQAGDRADGYTGVERFKERVNPKIKDIATGLSSEKVRGMFFAELGDDVVRDSTLVLADEVKKREQTLPLLRQDNINGKAAQARTDFNMVPQLMAEIEADLLQDNSISGEQKPAAILAAKKQIAQEAVHGFVDKGNAGQVKAFFQARAALKDNLAQIFTAEELRKQDDYVNDAERAYFAREWSAYTQNERLTKEQLKTQEEKAVKEYTEALRVASNDQFAFNAVQKKLQVDPRLSGETKKSLAANRVFMETGDDTYEGKFMASLIQKKNFDQAIKQLGKEYAEGKVSIDRHNKLLTAIRNMQDYQQKDPYLLELVRKASNEIGTYKKNSPYDGPYGVRLEDNSPYVAKAQTEFHQRIQDITSKGALTGSAVEAVKVKVIADYFGKQYVVQKVPGVAPENLTSADKIRGVIKEIGKDFIKNGKSWSPEKRKQEEKRLLDLRKNLDAADNLDRIKIEVPVAPKNARPPDEQ